KEPAPLDVSSATVSFARAIAAASTLPTIASTYDSFTAGAATTWPILSHAAAWSLPEKKIASIASSLSERISVRSGAMDLMPLDSGGLWLAVTTAPAAKRPAVFTLYWSAGVVTMPASATLTPADWRPAVSSATI